VTPNLTSHIPQANISQPTNIGSAYFGHRRCIVKARKSRQPRSLAFLCYAIAGNCRNWCQSYANPNPPTSAAPLLPQNPKQTPDRHKAVAPSPQSSLPASDLPHPEERQTQRHACPQYSPRILTSSQIYVDRGPIAWRINMYYLQEGVVRIATPFFPG
jgi:hypothetical protein